MGDFMCPHGRTSWGMCPHCIGVNSNSSLTPVPLPSPAPNREPTGERCEHGAVPASSCYDLRCLRAQLSREVEARRRAEATLNTTYEAMDALTAAGMGAPGKPNTLVNMVGEIIAERDAARAELATVRAALATAQGDLDSLTRELATICGGPGQPREGETRVAYWLRRVGETLAMTERERDEAKDQQRQLSDFAKDVARQRDEARAALATERETHNQTAADAQKLALALAEARDALATAERERDEERVSLRSLRTELWEGVRTHGLKVPSQGSESVRLIAAYCGGIVAAREKADRAESALATATGAMERAISALERIESRTDEPLTAGFARAEANALRTALAAPPPSPGATREGAQFRVGAGHPWEAWHGDIVTVVGPGNPEVCTEEDCTHHAHLSVTGDWSAEGLPVIDLEPLNEKARELLATLAPPPRASRPRRALAAEKETRAKGALR